jgi:tape measure domain-containing protein
MVAVTADEVIVALEARVGEYNAKIADAHRRFDRSMKGIEGAAARSERLVSRAMSGIAASIGTVSVIALARGLMSIADEAKNLDAQLRLATAQTGNFGQATADVRRIAETTRSSLSETASLYGNFTRNAKDLGINQADAARATETFAKTLKISGASAVDAAQGTRQFIQGLQSGVLRGDEFNSIMENSPRLARLLAESLGVPIGALRAMAEEGDLTSDKLVKALTDTKFTQGIDEEFKALPVTFDQAMGQIHNAAIITFGAFDRGGEFSTALANFIVGGTGGFAELERKAEEFGITARGNIEGLANAFEPIRQAASDFFDWLDRRSAESGDTVGFNIRRDIQKSLDDIDRGTGWLANQGMLGALLTGNDPMSPNGTRPGTGFGARNREGVAASDREQRLRKIMRTPIEGVSLGGGAAGSPRPPGKEKPGANAEVGRVWSASEAAAAFRARGFRITDTDRTPAQQQAQIDKWLRENPSTRGPRPAGLNGPHVRGKGLDFGREHSIASIKAAAKDLGIPIAQLLNEGDHKHLEIGGKGRGASAETLAKRQENARLAAERRQQAFDNELANANRDLLDARRALVSSAEIMAQIDRQDIETERAKYNDNLASQVSQKKLTAAEAEQLRVINDQIASDRTKLVDMREAERLRSLAVEAERARLDIETADLGNRQDLLRAQGSLAETTEERRRIEFQLLDLQFQEEEIRLKAIIAESARLDAIEDATEAEQEAARAARTAAEIAKQRLGVLPTLKGAAEEETKRANEGPLDRYRRELSRTSGDINSALEEIEVQGLKSLEDSLVSATTKALGLKGALGQIVGELIRVAAQQMILAAIGGPGGAGGSLLGSLFKFANGGEFTIGGRGGTDRNVMSINGKPVAKVSRGERVTVTPQGKNIRPVTGMVAPVAAPTIRNFNIHVSADHSVTPAGFARALASDILQKAQQMDAIAAKGIIKAVPMRMGQFSMDGV